jgi:ribonuclease P/MRP protein subunit POP8
LYVHLASIKMQHAGMTMEKADKEARKEHSPAASRTEPLKRRKATELISTTVRAPHFSYLRLEQLRVGGDLPGLDALQVRSYCDAALSRFLGVTGSAIPVDVLKAEGEECWLRVPHDDLGAFSAAVTAYPGLQHDGQSLVLGIRACGDWLGSLIGQHGQNNLWEG